MEITTMQKKPFSLSYYFFPLIFFLTIITACNGNLQVTEEKAPAIANSFPAYGKTDKRVLRPSLTKSQLITAPKTQTGRLAEFGFRSVGYMALRQSSEVPQSYHTLPNGPDHYTISADGRWLAFANGSSYHESIHLWDLKTLNQKYLIVDKSFEGKYLNFATYSRFHPIKPWLITTKLANKNKITCPDCQSVTDVWNIETGKRLLSITSKHREAPFTIMSDDKLYRLVDHSKIEHWDFKNGHFLGEIELLPQGSDRSKSKIDFLAVMAKALCLLEVISKKVSI